MRNFFCLVFYLNEDGDEFEMQYRCYLGKTGIYERVGKNLRKARFQEQPQMLAFLYKYMTHTRTVRTLPRCHNFI